ncbi:MAG: quinone-dependent dihydroorotate dehydrogenase [Bacteroidales bacterium]
MYKIIRPLLFLIKPETAHLLIVYTLKTLRKIPFALKLLKQCFAVSDKCLETKVLGLTFPNPIGLAAGFDKNAELVDELPSFGFGFVEVGSVTPLPQAGNLKPRLFRLPKDKAIINRMGFNNNGLAAMVQRLKHRKGNVIIGANIGKNTLTPNQAAVNDYLRCLTDLYAYAHYFVVNVSCPNVAGLCGLQDEQELSKIIQPLIDYRNAQQMRKPLLLKISPDLTREQLDQMINIVQTCGVDGIVLANTTTCRDGLHTSAKRIADIGNGGLSGSPLTQKSLDMVRHIHQQTKGTLPIIGVGGIMTEQDALNMLQAGASLVQLYTGFIYQGAGFVGRICKAIKKCKLP